MNYSFIRTETNSPSPRRRVAAALLTGAALLFLAACDTPTGSGGSDAPELTVSVAAVGSSISVSWDAPAAGTKISAYRVRIKDENGNYIKFKDQYGEEVEFATVRKEDVQSGKYTFTASALPKGKFTAEVAIVNLEGREETKKSPSSPASPANVTSQATAPAAATLGAPAATATGINLSWTAPALGASDKQLDGSLLTAAQLSYKVFYVANTATAPMAAATLLADSNAASKDIAAGTTQAALTGLTADTGYHILLRTINSTDPGQYSDSTVTVRKTAAAASQATAPPSAALDTPNATATGINLSWTAPTLDASHKQRDGSTLTAAQLSYKVFYVANTATSPIDAATLLADSNVASKDIAAGTTQATLTGLTAETFYHILLRTINSTDTEKFANGTVTVQTTAAAASQATAPPSAALDTPNATATGINLSWTAPTLDASHKQRDGSTLTAAQLSYKVYYVANTATSPIDAATLLADSNVASKDIAAGTTQAALTGLTAETFYHILLRTINSTDTEKFANGTVTVQTTGAATSQATAPPSATLATPTATATGISLSWTAPTLDTSHKQRDGSALTAAQLSYKVFYVANTATSPIDAATLLADSNVASKDIAAGTTQAALTGLMAETFYHILLRTINSTDTEKFANGTVTVQKTAAAASQATIPPSAALATPTATATGISLSWTAPTLDASHKQRDGSALTAAQLSYKVYYVANTATTAITAANLLADSNVASKDIAAGTTQAALTGLTAETSYHILLRTINSTDTEKFANGTVTVRKTAAAASQATIPPSAALATPTATATGISLSWTAPTLDASHKQRDGSALTAAQLSYKVYYVANTATTAITAATLLADSKAASKDIAAGTTQIALTGLTADTSYHILLRTINSTDTEKFANGTVTVRKTAAAMTVSSSSFTDGGAMPAILASTNPQISWTNVPTGTNSIVLFMYDLDFTNWRHWLVFNIPTTVASISEGTTLADISSSANRVQAAYGGFYYGPTPPVGTHTYKFTVFALKEATLTLSTTDAGLPGTVLLTEESALGAALRGFITSGKTSGTFTYNGKSYTVLGSDSISGKFTAATRP